MRNIPGLRGWLLAAAAAWLVSSPAPWWTGSTAAAEPSVRVRSESRIEIGVEYVGRALQVRGALRDELGSPLPNVEVAVTLQGDEPQPMERRLLTTDERGRFVLEHEAPNSQVVLQAAYTGDGLHRGVRVERRIDENRADVRLELQLPAGGRLDLDAEHIPIGVLAESDSGGQALPMTLRDEQGRVLAEGLTDPLGRLTWQVESAKLGLPGSGQLQLESRGDRTRGEAQTEARVVRFRRTELTLEASNKPPEAGSPMQVQGSLATAAGARVGQPVGLFIGGAHATTAITDGRGLFTAQLWPEKPGTLPVVARAERDPVGAYTEAERSLTVQVLPAGTLPWPWLLVAVLPGLAFWLRRSKARASRDPRGLANRTTLAGIEAAPRTLRKATDTRLGGVVVHSRTRAPVEGARVEWHGALASAGSHTTTDAHGQFAAEGCAGSVVIRISAPGFAELTTRAQCPHRGEWSHCQIRLESLRDRALAPYRTLVLPKLPSALSFNLWTPREIARALRGRLGPNIEPLSQAVENAAYAAQPPDEGAIDAIQTQAEELAPELAAGSAERRRRSLRPGSRH